MYQLHFPGGSVSCFQKSIFLLHYFLVFLVTLYSPNVQPPFFCLCCHHFQSFSTVLLLPPWIPLIPLTAFFFFISVFCPSMSPSGFVWMSACLLSSFSVLPSLVRFFLCFLIFSRGIQYVKNESKWVKKKSVSCFVLIIIIIVGYTNLTFIFLELIHFEFANSRIVKW